ncbi:hypothetical protein Fcan01_15713 [Folsomia candida]|uniref:Uncharacterized protein n=1 Tax=Folsomia candida TaxID=158441 RepID=A0A226DXU7_FOLCA|nr:hypothetical protein Fcan01_15713 [Folsomia candida]
MATIARSLASSVTWIRDKSLPSSNIPLVVSLTKMTLIVDQFPVTIHKGTFVLTGANKCQRILATSVICHLLVVLKWVLDPWFSRVNRSSPVWKLVFMYYFATLFGAIVIFIAHITLLKEETVYLLNSAMQVERASQAKGTNIVHRFYFVFIVLSKMAVIFMPMTCFTFGLLRPCMPPTWTSVIYLTCESWDDHGNTGFMFRIWGAILLYYLSLSVVATGVFAITIVLIYPNEVKLILLEAMLRDLSIEGRHVAPRLYTYRTLQMLTDMHNTVFGYLIMSILIGAITVCESFALYTIITSTSEVPIPVIILFSTVAVDLLIVIVGPFKMMANPLVKSIELLEALQWMNGSGWIRRFVRSCPPSKMTLAQKSRLQSSAESSRFLDKVFHSVVKIFFQASALLRGLEHTFAPNFDHFSVIQIQQG